MMESLEFTDEEIKRQLAALGYFNVSEARMKQFRKDLHKLIEHDRSTSGSSSWFTGVSSPSSNSDFSETSDKMRETKPAMLSRFQPHIRVPPREGHTMSQSTTSHDPSWMAEADITHPQLYNAASSNPTRDNNNATTLETQQTSLVSDAVSTEQSRWTESEESVNETQKYGLLPGNGEESATTEDSDVDSELSEIPTNTQSKIIRKRKVLRKQSDGTPRVFDESLMEDSSRGMYRIHDVSIDDSDPRLSRVTQKHALPPRPHSARPMWRKDPDFEAFVSPSQPPSYIRPNTSNPHTRNIKKTDPVNKYHQYKDFWTNIKAPGEKSHKLLRWEVKAQMMYKEEPAPKPQRVYVPNSYVVPTSKKRSALRWEVRHAMENGLPLPTTFDIY